MSHYLIQADMPTLKLWLLINKKINPYQRYDFNTLSECVVCAETEEEAKRQHPANCDGSAYRTINVRPEKQSSNRKMFDVDETTGKFIYIGDRKREIANDLDSGFFEWVESINDLEVVYLGLAKMSMEKGVVLAHWNRY